eukprot:TRINITY_DN2580_c0_g1_i14.p1 TRINITY_DN2580_c0_g1~~TRINITY_DN2580_c0_g1_i14.p1  ORF type:complete len:1005 (-),score=216.92 TRINITY_DN2580_c0_g1_i14:162-3176(-)
MRSILKQIAEQKLHRDFDYHRVPAPWIQTQILSILALLGADDQTASEGMYEVLFEVLRRADTGNTSSYAVLYETVRTISTIYPSSTLLEAAALCISRFIMSENHNLKYMGITALATLVQVNPKFAVDYQAVVIDSLEDPDETLKRKTLDLLFKMTNPSNVTFVVSRLVKHLRSTIDIYLRTELVSRITQLAERYAPSNSWFIGTMSTVFEIGGDLVRPEVHQNLMRLIAEGSGDDEEADNQLRQYAADTFIKLLSKPSLNDTGIQLVAWVVGEYGYLSESHTLESIIDQMCDLADRHYESTETRGWIISALAKLVSQLGSCPSHVQEVFQKFQKSRLLSLTQRCTEFLSLSKDLSYMQQVLPMDASCEDIEIDEEFSVVDDFVNAALRRGASPYISRQERGEIVPSQGFSEDKGLGISSLRFEAYERPTLPSRSDSIVLQPAIPVSATPIAPIPSNPSVPIPIQPTTANSVSPLSSTPNDEISMQRGTPNAPSVITTGAPRKWGKAGYAGDQSTAPKQNEDLTSPTTSTPVQVASGVQSSPVIAHSSIQPTHTPTTTPTTTTEAMASPRQQPHQMSEKEKLASMLFSGIASEGAGGKHEKTRKAKTNSTVARVASVSSSSHSTPTQAAVNSNATLLDQFDLLDLAASTATSSAPAKPVTSTKPPSSGTDLLSLDLLSFDSVPPVSKAPHASNMFGGIDAPLQPTGSPLLSPSPMALHSPLSTVSTSSPYGNGQNQPTSAHDPYSAFGMAAASDLPLVDRLPPQIRDEIKSSKPSVDPVLLAQDNLVSVYLFKVLRQDHVMLCLAYQINSARPIPNIGSRFETSPNVTVADKQSLPPWQPGHQGWYNIGQDTLVCDVVRLRMKECFEAVMNGRVFYVTENSQTQTTLPLTIAMPISDYIRPFALTTDAFGQKWGQSEFERRIRINTSSVTTPQEYLSKLEKNLNIHPIQIIGWEAISAGNVITRNLVCLIHGKLTGQTLDITIRTKEKQLSSSLADACQAVFQSK